MTNYKENINHPWQNGPTELIAHAIEHLHKGTEFDNWMAFLLFDIGVETIFKTYLMLSDNVTGAKISFQRRKDASNGISHTIEDEKRAPRKDLKFHDLIKGLLDSKPEIKNEFDLSQVEYFHEKRNSLYHDGNGITIMSDNLKSYSAIAVKLLKYLLDIDLDDSLHAPEIEAKLAETKDQEWKAIVNMKDELIKSRMRLGVAARLVVEIIAPELSKGVFIRVLHKKYHQSVEFAEEYLYQVIKRSFPDDHNRIPAIGIESIFADPNKLYLIITDEFIGINKAYDLYEVSKYDPEKFITPVYSEPDEKGNLVDKTMPHHEYISEISKWLLDMDTEIKKKIATIEMWLDKQDLDNN